MQEWWNEGTQPELKRTRTSNLALALKAKGEPRAELNVKEPLYTVREAATYFRVSEWTIYCWIRQGKIIPTRIGGGRSIRFTLKQIADCEAREG